MTAARKPRILVLGTLDTKGAEFAFLRDEIAARGCECTVMDLGILGTPAFPADIPRERVLEAAGWKPADFTTGERRGEAVQAAIDGGRELTAALHARGEIDGVIAMGGGSGTAMARAIFDALPFGFPKVIVTTLTNVNPVIKGSDVVLVRSLVDILGLNSVTKMYIGHAAGAISGMAGQPAETEGATPSIVITCLGVTTPGVMALREKLVARGKEVIVLHRRTAALDVLMRANLVEAVVDFTPSEITESALYPKQGDPFARLSEVRDAGIPVVVGAGGLDMLIQLVPAGQRPEELADRPFVVHSPTATLIRTAVDEQRQLGAILGRQIATSRGRAMAVLPMRGFSMWDQSGRSFDQPDARRAFADAMLAAAGRDAVQEVDAHVNDVAYADAVVDALAKLLDERE